MKCAASILSIIVAVFVTGCQDQTATGPVLGNTETMPINKSTAGIESITLNGVLPEPGSDVHFVIVGRVDYATVRIPGTLDQFDVSISTTAQLGNSQIDQLPFVVAESSTHRVNVTEEGVVFMTLAYVIESRADRLALVLEYQITQEHIEVAGMWLEFVE